MVTLRRARPEEAGVLTDLALAAKAYWGYDEAFMDSVRDELTFSPDDVVARQFVVAELDGVVIGFYCLGGTPPLGELEDMWIRPDRIGTGLGRVLWQDAMAAAAAAGFEHLEIAADPFAEGFYLRMGAERIGEVPSGSIAGRVLPRLRVTAPDPRTW
jgi:N-acetylglutamate synthase-like GNAT family acetyltransferase